MAKETTTEQKTQMPDGRDLVGLDFEHQAALESIGQDKVYGFWGLVWRIWNRFHVERTLYPFKKKTYLILLVLTGWIGGHRYYERRWKLGLLYTAFFWTGVPLAMCIIDALIVIPVKPDENGMITV